MMSGWRRTSREVMQPCRGTSVDELEAPAAVPHQPELVEQPRGAVCALPSDTFADLVRGCDEVTERGHDLLRESRRGRARGLHVQTRSNGDARTLACACHAISGG